MKNKKISDLVRKLKNLQKAYRFYQKKQELIKTTLKNFPENEFYYDIQGDLIQTRQRLKELEGRIRKLRKLMKKEERCSIEKSEKKGTND